MEQINFNEEQLNNSKNFFRMNIILFTILLVIFSSQIFAFCIGGFIFIFSNIIEVFTLLGTSLDSSYIEIIGKWIGVLFGFGIGFLLFYLGFKMFSFFLNGIRNSFVYFKLISNNETVFYQIRTDSLLSNGEVLNKKTKVTISIGFFSKEVKIDLKKEVFPEYLIILYDNNKTIKCCNYEYLSLDNININN